MKNLTPYALTLCYVVIVCLTWLTTSQNPRTSSLVTLESSPSPTQTLSPSPQPASQIPSAEASRSEFSLPIAEAAPRVTKKPFGIYITPATSPVQPEVFTGYHTGVDIEYNDVTDDVPVYALADGTITTSRTASGYGGVITLTFRKNDSTYVALYGHLDPSRLPALNSTVTAGERVAFLGKGYSAQTDFERRHLHLSLRPGSSLDLRGYVQRQSELDAWLDPLKFLTPNQ